MISAGGSYFPTYSGHRIDVLHPDPSHIRFRDIAHALSQICRYAGHTSKFYSVAEHCVRLSWVSDPLVKCLALMHDASEAYVQDIPRPVKRLRVMKPYRDIEENLEEAICRKYKVGTYGDHPLGYNEAAREFNEMDLAMPLAECHLAKLYVHPWNLPPLHGKNESVAMKVAQRIFEKCRKLPQEASLQGWGWSPSVSESEFVAMGIKLGINVED